MNKKTRGHMLGKHQKALLEFARRNPGWHSYAKDALTTKTVMSLVKREMIEINEFRQFRKIES